MRELFKFQNTESPVSEVYVTALQDVLDPGVCFSFFFPRLFLRELVRVRTDG